MSKFLVAKEVETLGEEIAALVQILDKSEGGGGFLQSGRSRQTLAEARERAKKISATEDLVSEQVRSLQAVLDGLRDGVLLLDREGKILLFNGAAERLLSLQSSDQTLDQWLKRYKFVDSDSKTVMHDLHAPFVKALSGISYADEPIFVQEKDNIAARVHPLTMTTVGNNEPMRSVVTIIVSEISEAQNITHKLELLNASVQELREGILVIDEAGSYLLLNNAAKKLLLTERPQGRMEDWLKNHVVCSDENGTVLDASRNPFVRAMAGERFQDAPVVVRRQDSSESHSLKITARSLAGKGKTKSKVSAVVVHEAAESMLPDPAALEELREQLNENMQQLSNLNGLIAERDEKVRELHQQITESTQREYDIQRVSDTRVKVLEQQKTVEQLKALEHQQMLEQQRAIRFAVTKVLGEALSLSEVAPTLMQEICGTLGWSLGFIWELDETLQYLRRLDLWQVPKADFTQAIKWSRGAKFAYGEGLPGRVMQNRQPMWLESIPADDPIFEVANNCNLKSAFAFPIFSGPRITGVMQFLSASSKASDGELIPVFQDISKQLSQFSEGKRAEEQRAQLTAIVDTSDDAIIFVSLAGNILRWNKGAGVLFGHSVDSMRGKPLTAVIAPEHIELVNENIRRSKRGERVERCELACVTKDGGMISVSTLFAPVLSLDGGVSGISVVARAASQASQVGAVASAVSPLIEPDQLKLEELSRINDQLKDKEAEINRLNEEMHSQAAKLADMKKELDDSAGRLSQVKVDSTATERFKSLFLSTVGREIRSPIESILSLSDQLAMAANANDETRDFANLIHDSGAVIANVVNDIIEITKIEDGELSLELADFSLIGCVEQAAEMVASRASHKRLSILTFVAPDVPSLLVGDRSRLMQVISKLTELVVTVTERGGVVLRANVLQLADNEATIRVSFSDTGAGVSSQATQKAIAQITQSTGDEEAFSDVGLRVVRRLLQLMKGEISHDPGGAGIFSLILRLPVSQNKLDPVGVEGHVKQSRILVIEGPTGVSRIASAYCADWGVQCDVAVTADDALAALKQQKLLGNPYHIVLMEKVMFGMNGFELAAAIRAVPELHATRLILFNPYGEAHREAQEHPGFARVIRGPMSQSLFLKHLTSLLASDPEATRSNAGGTTLSFALEQLALGQALEPQTSRSTRKIDAEKALPGNSELFSPSGEAVVDMATARASMIKKAKKNTKQSMPSYAAATAPGAQFGQSSGNNVAEPKASVSDSAEFTELRTPGNAASANSSLPDPASVTDMSTDQSEPAEKPPEFVDLQGLRRICGDSGMIEIVQEFMATAEKLLQQMEIAVEQGEAEDCRRQAELLKAAAGALGAKQIIELANAMQNLTGEDRNKNKILFRSLQHSFDALKSWILPQLEKSG